MPGRSVRMGHGDPRFDTPHHAHGNHTSNVPVYSPSRKPMNTAPGPVSYKSPAPGTLPTDKSEHSLLAGPLRRGRRRGRRRRGPRSRKDRHDKQESNQQGSTEISEQTFGSRSCSPSSSPCASPPQEIEQQTDLVFGSSISGLNGGDRHLGLSDTYASATQRWLSTQQGVVHDSVERQEDHFKQQRDVKPSPISKPAPRRPRPAFLGCHLPIPATEVAETKPFPLSAPCYTADELSLPRPYNADYPHPLTVYASPAVNPATVAASGYAPLLRKLKEKPEEMMGNILAECGKPNVTALGLTLDRDSKDGCGIPEKYWLRLSSWDGVKVPLGAVVPFARSSRGIAPRLVASRSESSPPQPTPTALPESPPLTDVHSRSETDLTNLASTARFARRSSDAGLKQPLSLAQWNADRRGSLPNISRLHSARESTLPVLPRHSYTPVRKSDSTSGDLSRSVSKTQLLSPVPETDALHPIGAERKLLRKTRPPSLGLPLPTPVHGSLGIADSIDIVLEDKYPIQHSNGVRGEEILTPLSARTSLPVTPRTPRTPLTPRSAGQWHSSLSTTLEFSAGKSIWS